MNLGNSELENIARIIRKDVVHMVYSAGDGHPGPALSAADIIAALYFHVLNIRPEEPDWADRDRVILSKGHACPALYSALARRGYFPVDELTGLRTFGSMLQGHPDMLKTPGIDMTSGSLGNGLAAGMGMAMAARLGKKDYTTYVITGDGELEEGVVWETFLAAARYNLHRLIVIIDNNGMQSGGKVSDISSIDPILPKLEAFGWNCWEIDGHDIGEIISCLEQAACETSGPSAVLAHTIKGKGVPFMVGDNSWHKRVPTDEQYHQAMEILGGPYEN